MQHIHQLNQGGNQGPKEPNPFIFEDLTPYMDKTKIEGLNIKSGFPVENCLNDRTLNIFTKSDCDQQILINIGFLQPVKIHHLVIKALKDKSAPKVIKLFSNKLNMDFDKAENDIPTQELVLKESNFNDITELRYVNFQNVSNLSIFAQENFGCDYTVISSLQLFGCIIQDMNVNNIKKNQLEQQE